MANIDTMNKMNNAEELVIVFLIMMFINSIAVIIERVGIVNILGNELCQ